MAKPSDRELTKHTLNLYAGQYEKLQELFPDIPASTMIRKILEDFIHRIEPKRTLPENLGVDLNV